MFQVTHLHFSKQGIWVNVLRQLPGLMHGVDVEVQMGTGFMVGGTVLFQGDYVEDRRNKGWIGEVKWSVEQGFHLSPPHPVDENTLAELNSDGRLRIVGNIMTHVKAALYATELYKIDFSQIHRKKTKCAKH